MKFEVDLDEQNLEAQVARHIQASLKRELKKSDDWVRDRIRDEMSRQIEAAVLNSFPLSDLSKEADELISEKRGEVEQLTKDAMRRVKEKLDDLEAEIDKLRPREKFERKIDTHLQWAALRALGLPYKP